jgi:hypothetical protein
MARSNAPTPMPVSLKSRAMGHVSCQTVRRPPRFDGTVALIRSMRADRFAYIMAIIVSATIATSTHPSFLSVRRRRASTEKTRNAAAPPKRPERDNEARSAAIMRQTDTPSHNVRASASDSMFGGWEPWLRESSRAIAYPRTSGHAIISHVAMSLRFTNGPSGVGWEARVMGRQNP